jgi:hypothetical protein
MSDNSSLDKCTDEQEFQDFFQLFFEQEEEEEEHHDDGDEDKEGRTSTMRATNDLKHHPPNQCDYVSGGVSPPARSDYTSTRHRLQPKKNTEDRPQELILDHYQEQRERRIMALSSSAASSLANSIIDEEISEVRTTAKKQHMASRITMRSIQNPKNTNTTSAFINRTDSTARRSVDEQGDNSQLQPQEDTAVVLSSGSSGRAIDKNGSNKMISIHRTSPAWGSSSSTMETTSWSLSNKDTLGSGVGFRKRRDIDITRNSLACQPPFKKRMAPPVIEQNADLIGTNQQQHHQRHSNEEDSSSRPTFSSCNTEGQYRGMNLLSRELSGRDSLSVFNAATSNPCVLSATSAEDEEVNKSNKKDLPEQDNKLLVEKGITGNQNAVNVVSSNDFYLLQQGQMGEHVNHTMMMRYYEQMLLRNSLNSTMALFTPNVAVPYSGYVTPSFLPLQPAKIQQPNSASAIRMQSPQVAPSYDLECKNTTTSRENTNNIGQKKDISIENVSLSTRRRKQTKERERRAELTTKFQVLADLLKDIEAESHDILYPSNFATVQKDKVDDKLKKNQEELAALSQDDHFNLSNRVEIITKTVDILQKLRQTNKSLQQMVTELRDSKRQSE